MRDIEEQEEYEKYLYEKADVLENICVERGIGLWNEDKENDITTGSDERF